MPTLEVPSTFRMVARLSIPVALGYFVISFTPQALALVDVRLLDHIIVSTGAALSMAEQDMEPFAMAPPAPALPVRPKRGRPRKNTDQASTV